jgi:hypothetical protein
MNAPLAHPVNGHKLAAPLSEIEIARIETVYAARCHVCALLFINGQLSLHEAVDELQAYAEQSGLIDHIGQDEAQAIMAYAFFAVDFLPEPEDDPDDPDIVRRWEMADPRDRWKWTGETPPPKIVRNSDIGAKPEKAPYRTPQATIDAFWHVAGLDDPDYLKRWLAQHPRDAETLCKLWEGKNGVKA